MSRILAALALATALPAAEFVLRDVQLGLSALPTAFDFTLDSGTETFSGDDGFDAGSALWGGLRWGFSRPGDSFGLSLGADALLFGFTGENLDYAGFGGRLCGGGGWAFHDDWTATAELGLAYGLGAMALDATSVAPSADVDGTWLGYDARLALTYRLSRAILVQAHLGWLSATDDLSGDGLELELERDGVYGGLAVVWRLSAAPPRLD